jgi:hypothetical protein
LSLKFELLSWIVTYYCASSKFSYGFIFLRLKRWCTLGRR